MTQHFSSHFFELYTQIQKTKQQNEILTLHST